MLSGTVHSGPFFGFENLVAYLKGKQFKITVLETFDIFAATLKRTS